MDIPLRATSRALRPFLKAIDGGSPDEMRKHFLPPSSFEKGVLDPADVSPLLSGIGGILFDCLLFDLARPYFERVVALHSGETSAAAFRSRSDLAVTFFKLGFLPEAIASWNEMIESERRQPQAPGAPKRIAIALLNKGRIHADLVEERQARRSFEDGLTMAEKDSSSGDVEGRLLHELGHLMFRRGDMTEAATYFERAYERKLTAPDIPVASVGATQLMLGRALLQRKEIMRAREILEIVARSGPGVGVDEVRLEAIDSLANEAVDCGNKTRARRWIRYGRALYPASDKARVAAINIEFAGVRILVKGSARRRALWGIVQRLRRLRIPGHLAAKYADAHFGIVSSYLAEGEQGLALKHARDVLPSLLRLVRRGHLGTTPYESFKAVSEMLSAGGPAVVEGMRRARYGVAFPDESLLSEGEWMPESMARDIATAKDACARMLSRLQSLIPGMPEIEVAIVRNDRSASASVARFRKRYLVGIRSGAILRIGRTLSAALKRPDVLALWNMADFATMKGLAVTDDGIFPFGGDADALDPLRDLVRTQWLALSVSYLLCHEIAHAIFGHRDYLDSHPDVPNSVRHAFEIDADLFATETTLNLAFDSIQKDNGVGTVGDIWGSPPKALCSWMLAIYAYLQYVEPLDAGRDPFSSTHPARTYRYLANGLTVNARVPDLWNGEVPVDVPSLSAMVKMVEAALAAAGSADELVRPSLFSDMDVYVRNYGEYMRQVLGAWKGVAEEVSRMAVVRRARPS